MTRDSFIMYRSFVEAIDDLDLTDRGRVYDAIAHYALDGTVPQLEGAASAVFKMARPQLDANTRRWRNAQRGGAPAGNRNAAKAKNNRKTTEKQPNVNVNENENENENESKPKKDKSLSLTIDQRCEDFKAIIKPYVERYGKDMCNAFYAYWTEPNKSGTHMRFELEKTWDVARRLRRWSNNNYTPQTKHNETIN